MTIRQAVEQGVARVRRADWEPGKYVELPLDGGQLAHLIDPTLGEPRPIDMVELLRDTRDRYLQAD